VLLRPVLETRAKLAAETQKFDKNFQFSFVISSENDFNKNNKAPMPVMQMPAQNVMEKPPILWFYVDPHGTVRVKAQTVRFT
jgi:hypothetical protein